ncbi:MULTISPECIES: hypothetical protein [unclassified Devosia]|uniref:hypothetical protein n=1 Tax=unclassified Devosia TaxID=196773 RepID=UPI00086F64B1|nr:MULTISPECIES: hypothetical protein [unclassified Devosia]MBN9360887.1 hypothetical protein [Devosia sp.]ODS88138.1 MAG: hypothetical protein ABS47_10300 [Devosia sp. SCN 66-27]OJX22833.1 MAG: hypothetical protein BGO83_18850 [Devosia sp. 66-14]
MVSLRKAADDLIREIESARDSAVAEGAEYHVSSIRNLLARIRYWEWQYDRRTVDGPHWGLPTDEELAIYQRPRQQLAASKELFLKMLRELGIADEPNTFVPYE